MLPQISDKMLFESFMPGFLRVVVPVVLVLVGFLVLRVLVGRLISNRRLRRAVDGLLVLVSIFVLAVAVVPRLIV